MRLALYAGASTALAAGVVVHAFNQRPNFYSACVYLSQSNLSLMILTNLTLFLVTSFVYALQRTFYGPLRPIEIEQLYEKGWFAITETCLAMTIFREEVGAWFLVMFVALMAGKSWGWVGEGRVEVLEQQPPANPRLFHIRLSISLAMSVIYDMWFLAYTINAVVQQARPNMMVMFLFEFGILTACSYSTALRYGISLIEASVVKKQTQEMLEHRRHEIREQREEILRERAAAASSGEPMAATDSNEPLPSEDDVEEMDIEAPGWETKGQWVLTLDLMTDFVKLGIYTAFFFILLSFYGLPIHIMRDLFITARSFIKRLNAFLKYRNATRDMNQRYPDATVEEIEREDTCIICREEMRPWSVTNPAPGAVPNGVPQPPATRTPIISERSRPKKLPCGHVLHLGCLKSWLERQQVCPTCRRPVVDRPQPQMPVHGVQPQLPGQQPLPNIAGPGQLPIANANGVRGAMINIGPLRLAFGRGPMPNMGAPNPPAHPGHQHGIPPNARVYGLELGFPPAAHAHGPAQGVPPPGARGADFHAQLEQVEAQIIQEIRSLSVAHAELRVVRNLQAEMARLRQLQGIGSQQPLQHVAATNQQPLQHVAATNQQPLQHAAATNPLRPPTFATRTTSTVRHGPAPGAVAIQAGSSDLPPGVTIPEGWSLLPLQNMDVPPQATVSDTSARPRGESPMGPGATRVYEPTPTTVPFPGSPAVNLPSQAEQPIARGTSASTDLLGDLQATTSDLGDTPSNGAPAIPNPPPDVATTTETSSPPAPSADLDHPAPSDAHETHEASLPNWSSTALFPGERPMNGAASGTNPATPFASSQADEAHESAAAPTTGPNGEDGVERAGGGGAGEEEKATWKGKGKAASVEEAEEEE